MQFVKKKAKAARNLSWRQVESGFLQRQLLTALKNRMAA